MNHYLIIADDFTGSNDTGVQLRRRGIPVRVVFSGRGIRGGESAVLDTESRALTEEAAFLKLSAELETIPPEQFHRVIKKTDSTLRGNIGAETRAVAAWYRPELIVFAPALPDLGRTTVNRIHRLKGRPVSETEPARDPKTPVKNDDVQKILRDAFDEEVIHTGLAALRGGGFSPEGGRLFSFDAETNADLQKIAGAVLATGRRVLWVGASALADNLLAVDRPLPPALGVIASLSSVSRAQALFAEKQGIALVKVPLREILEQKTGPEAAAAEAAALLRQGRDVILLSSSTYSEEDYRQTEAAARRAGLSVQGTSDFTQDLMGRAALRVLGGAKISGLFLSGGDTAMGCFEKAGALGSSIITEIAAGIPLMRLIGGNHGGLKVVTKAGAFGGEDAVFYALRKLREADEPALQGRQV